MDFDFTTDELDYGCDRCGDPTPEILCDPCFTLIYVEQDEDDTLILDDLPEDFVF